ncbi:MAG: hypothetical protein HY537_15370 [Deltaproteobacteria bacterium]|nr:hypothetical protein [Deltaproteobacteria bacterium]
MNEHNRQNRLEEVLDYEALVKAYYQNLHTTLRNFRAGPPFLESWVHDEDHNRSILGIFEAAASAGVHTLTVKVGTSLAAQLDQPWLKENLAAFGNVHMQTEGDFLNIHIGGQCPSATLNPPIESSYQESIGRFFSSGLTREGKLGEPECPAERVIKATYEKITLNCQVDEKGLVKKARHFGANGPLRTVVDCFCQILEGRSLQEGSDHGVIRLEKMLRSETVAPTIKGLITADNTDPIFKTPKMLIRSLYSEYSREQGKDAPWNNWTDAVSSVWNALSTEERLYKVRETIMNVCKQLKLPYCDLEPTAVKNNSRIILVGHQYLNQPGFGHHLMLIEKELKRLLEPTLEIVLESREDTNKREARTKRDNQ